MSEGEEEAGYEDVPEPEEAVGVDIADPAGVPGEVGDPQHHRQLLVRGVTSRHLHHHALPALHEQRSDEDEENIIEEECAQEDGADLQARQSEDFQHVDTEHDAQDVLEYPRPVRLPVDEPDGGGGDAGGQEEELPEFQLEDAEEEVTPGQSDHGQAGHLVARHHHRLQAAVHGQGARHAEHRHYHIN